MYMAVRYEGSDTSYYLEIKDYTNTAPSGQPFYGKLSTLLQWHAQDPPDAWELRRNNRTAERQGTAIPLSTNPALLRKSGLPVPWPFQV
jgi:endonuclease I